jgi:hypothetical protein
MAAFNASLVMSLAVLAVPATILATLAELAPHAVMFGLAFCLLLFWSVRLASRAIDRFGFRASRRRVTLMVALWVIVIPCVLSSIVFWVLLGPPGSRFAEARPALWFLTTLTLTIPIGLYHAAPAMIGSTIVQSLSLNGMFSSLPVEAWSILYSVAAYGFLTIAVVIGSHFIAARYPRLMHFGRTRELQR